MNSCNAISNNRFTTWRWIVASDWRRRSRRGGKRAAGSSAPADPVAFQQFQPDQETVCQHDQGGVAMQAVPQAALILVPAQQALGLFMELFNPVAAVRILDHDAQRRGQGKVAPEILPLVLAPRGPLADQPADVPRAVAIDSPTPPGQKLAAQTPLT